MRLQKLRFYTLAFYFFPFFLSRVCAFCLRANARSPRLISPLTTRFFPFPTGGMYISVKWRHYASKTFKHFVFLSIFPPPCSSVRGHSSIRAIHPFPKKKKRKPVHTPIRISCVQRVNGNFKCFPPTETYIHIYIHTRLSLNPARPTAQMHRPLPPLGETPPRCACVYGASLSARSKLNAIVDSA